MAEYSSSWLNRVGEIAAATYTPDQGQPTYGAALDIGTAPSLSPQQFEDATNAVQTVSDETYASKQQLTQETELSPAEQDAMEQAQEIEEARQRLEEVNARIEKIRSEAGYDEETGKGDFNWDSLGELAELDKEQDSLRKQVQGRSSNPFGKLVENLAGVDDETGLNRTERNWLRAQSNQDAQIKGLLGRDWTQQDTELHPELASLAEEAMKTGEWTPELQDAYDKYQQGDASNVATKHMTKPLDWLEKNVVSKGKRYFSTATQVAGQALQTSPADIRAGELDTDVGEFFEAENWTDAWERSEHISIGQAGVDAGLLTQDERNEAYSAGFDEFGNPIDKSYYNLRKGGLYNVTSGTLDFAAGWYLDPLVGVGKAAGATRAISKMDFDRMPAVARQRIERITTAPSSRFEEVAAKASKLNPVDQAAIRARRRMDEVTAKVRSGEADEVWMHENVGSFKDNLLAAGLWRESALVTKKKFDPTTGKHVDVLDDAGNKIYDDEVHDLTRAALMGNGLARAQLADKAEINDFFTALESDKLDAADDLISRMKVREEELLTDPNIKGFQRYERLHATRQTLEEAELKAKEFEGQLAQYDSYHRFMNATLDSADATTLRTGSFKTNKNWGEHITSYSFKPSAASNVTVTATRVPLAAWRKRAKAIDLSGHGSLQEQAPRIFDEIAQAAGVREGRHGHRSDVLEDLAFEKGFEGGWGELRTGLINQAARARTDVERRAVAQRIEDIGIEAVARKHGMNSDTALAVGMRVKGRKADLIARARLQSEQAKAMGITDEDTFRYVYAEGNTVNYLDMPISATQLQNEFVPLSLKDLNRFLTMHGDSLKNTFGAQVKQKLRKGQDIAIDAGELFNQFWKPLVLFRGGYAIRNLSEEAFRILGHTGSFVHLLGDMPRAAGVGTVNLGIKATNFATRNFPALQKWKGSQLKYVNHAGTQANEITVGGQRFKQAFAPGSGDIHLALNSSGDSMDAYIQSYRNNMNKAHKGALLTRRTIEGEEGHADAWLHVLNHQVKFDPMRMMYLKGASEEDIVRWLKRDPKGREYARRMPRRGHDPEGWVEAQIQEVDTLVQDPIIRAKLANDETITLDDLKLVVDDPNRASPVAIDEAATSMVSGIGALPEFLDDIVTKGYHVLATLPTDTLARNPFFNRQYRSFLARQTESLDPARKLSEAAQRSMEKAAREAALKSTRRYLFSLSDDTDLTHMLRFFSPFMGAWSESMKAWGRIFTENPESFVRLGVNGWMDMDDLYFIEMVDQDGRNAQDPDHEDLNTAVTQMPKWMLKPMGVLQGNQGKALDVLAPNSGLVEMPVSKQTLNTTLQGSPFWLPGAGPLVQWAGSNFVKDMPELSDENAFTAFMYKYLYPTGVPKGFVDSVKSTLWRRLDRQIEGMEDPVFTRSADLLYKSMLHEWDAKGRPKGQKPSKKEAKEVASAVNAFYVGGALVSPFSFQLQPGTQFFVDKAHQYKDEFGFQEGYKRYMKDYGEDAYLFWYSNTKSKAGVPPTSAGFKGYKKYKDLVEENPDIGLAIVGMDTQDKPFNYPVYSEEERQGLRETLEPGEAVATAEAQQGWEEWRKFNTAIEAELVARGIVNTLPSGETVPGNLQRSGAEDLALMKHNFREELRRKYEGWGKEYDTFNKGRSYDVVGQFRNVLESDKGPENIGWEGVAEYMEIHDAVARELDARGSLGGSSSIESEDNADVLAIFNGRVAEIRQSNLEFAEIYYRYLDGHTLTNGSNGQLEYGSE